MLHDLNARHFQIHSDAPMTIHDAVDSFISEKVSRHDQDQAARKASKGSSHSYSPTPNPVTVIPPLKSASLRTFDKPTKPLPEIQVWQTPPSSASPQVGGSSMRSASLDNDVAKQRRLEAERLQRQAEKEFWKKAEEEFNRLPQTPLPSVTPLTPLRSLEPSRPSHSRSASNLEVSRPSSSASILKPLRRSSADLPPIPSSQDEERDRELAAQLQAELAREIEDEDEKKARKIAASLHRQWESEADQPRSSRKGRSRSTSRSNVRQRERRSSSNQSNVTPERRKVLDWIKSSSHHSSSPTGSPSASRSASPNPIPYRREHPPPPVGPVPIRRTSIALLSANNTNKPSAPVLNL